MLTLDTVNDSLALLSEQLSATDVDTLGVVAAILAGNGSRAAMLSHVIAERDNMSVDSMGNHMLATLGGDECARLLAYTLLTRHTSCKR